MAMLTPAARRGGHARQPCADAVDDPRPLRRVPVPLQHRGERDAHDARAERHRMLERGVVARRVQPAADHRDQAIDAPGERSRIYPVEPGLVELDHPRADLLGDLEEAVEPCAGVALEPQRVGQPVWVQPDDHGSCSSSSPHVPVTDGPRPQRSVHSPGRSPRAISRSPSRLTSTAPCCAPSASNSRTVRASPSAQPEHLEGGRDGVVVVRSVRRDADGDHRTGPHEQRQRVEVVPLPHPPRPVDACRPAAPPTARGDVDLDVALVVEDRARRAGPARACTGGPAARRSGRRGTPSSIARITGIPSSCASTAAAHR